jgi:hypothetical protein
MIGFKESAMPVFSSPLESDDYRELPADLNQTELALRDQKALVAALCCALTGTMR